MLENGSPFEANALLRQYEPLYKTPAQKRATRRDNTRIEYRPSSREGLDDFWLKIDASGRGPERQENKPFSPDAPYFEVTGDSLFL
jgi:hypothetical protein